MRLSSPNRPFVIVARRPRTRLLALAFGLAWLGSIWVVHELTLYFSVPGYAELRAERDDLATRLAEASRELEQERGRASVLQRSDQISRAANDSLQQTVVERDEEIAALRGDVAFYERLVGSSAQRKGLAVHGLSLKMIGGGELQYLVTLTQTLKRAGHTAGELVIEIEGVRNGQLATVGWTALREGADTAPQPFSFRYFQQLEGSIMVPDDFTPHRLRVEVKVDGDRVERIFPWQEVLPQQGA